MLSQKISLANIKRLAQQELNSMDLIIKDRLLNKEKLVQDITYHIIKSGGKRLRPALTILSAKLFGYENGNRHINLAAAVEFIHTATLLHDDVVDHSKLRRGSPTANQEWDNKSSILVGDFLFSQAFLLISEDRDPKTLEILSKASSVIAEGEVRQLSSISNLNLSIDEYLQIISAKTAELFAASCQVGPCIAGKDKNIQTSMYKFGLNLGMVFQIIDDILDYVANQNSLGKTIGDDFKEKKVTLPVIMAYSLSNDEEKRFWDKCFSLEKQLAKDFDTALLIFDKYEVIDNCMNMAVKFIEEAKKYINLAPDNPIKYSLLEILNFSANRKF